MGEPVKKIVSPVTNLFSPPKPPKLRTIVRRAPEAARAPERAAREVQEGAAEAVRRARPRRGRASTIITALEDQLPAGAVSRKTLLGA